MVFGMMILQILIHIIGDMGYGNFITKSAVMEKHTGLKLSKYSYARIYKQGDILARHKDEIPVKYLQL